MPDDTKHPQIPHYILDNKFVTEGCCIWYGSIIIIIFSHEDLYRADSIPPKL